MKEIYKEKGGSLKKAFMKKISILAQKLEEEKKMLEAAKGKDQESESDDPSVKSLTLSEKKVVEEEMVTESISSQIKDTVAYKFALQKQAKAAETQDKREEVQEALQDALLEEQLYENEKKRKKEEEDAKKERIVRLLTGK